MRRDSGMKCACVTTITTPNTRSRKHRMQQILEEKVGHAPSPVSHGPKLSLAANEDLCTSIDGCIRWRSD
jgi:hypothetical protein